MQFFMNQGSHAAARGSPALPTALLSQVSCATAEPIANALTIAANKIRFIMGFSLSQDIKPRHRPDCTLESRRDQAPKPNFVDKMPAVIGPLFASGCVQTPVGEQSIATPIPPGQRSIPS